MPSMLRSLVAAAGGAALAGAAAVPEVHCVGRVAHTVTYSGPGPIEEVNVVVRPDPAYDAQCSNGGLGVGDIHLCLGINADATCDGARRPTIPLPLGARCQNCFVGAATDVWYFLNITGLRLDNVGLGFKGTGVQGTLQLEDDEGKATKDRKGSITLFSKIHEFKIRLLRLFELDIKVGMPTEIYYETQAWENAHGDLGVNFDLNMGDHYVEWTRGQGWTVKKDKAQLHVKGIHEGDYNIKANFTMGVKAELQASLGKLLWFHVDVAPEFPLSVSSIGASGADLMHNCLHVGRKFDLAHEADLDLSIFNHSIVHHHFGPHTDRHSEGSVIDKCRDLHPHWPHPPRAGEIVV